MLMEIFRGQTEISCTYSGRNEFIPPNNEQNFWLSLCQMKKTNVKVTNYELLRKSRPKIYAILCAIKEKYKDKVEIANEHYQLFNEKLNTDDQVCCHFN